MPDPTGVLISQLLPTVLTPRKLDGSLGELDAASVFVASSNEAVARIIDLMITKHQPDGTDLEVTSGPADKVAFKVNPISIPAPDAPPVDITANVDGDIGDGVQILIATGQVVVSQDPNNLAVTLEMTFLPPIPKA